MGNDPGWVRQMIQEWEVWQKTYRGHVFCHGQFLMKILQLICLETNNFNALCVNSWAEQRDYTYFQKFDAFFLVSKKSRN